MGVEDMLKQKLVSIPEAIGLVKSGQTVATGIAASEAVGLLTEREVREVEDRADPHGATPPPPS